jgi:rod shape-determining protein MreD
VTGRVGMFGLVITTVLLLQTVVAPTFAVAGWRPDLLLVTVVAFALADGAETGARYGFAAGLGADLLSGPGQLVGISALVLLLVGYGLGSLRPYLPGTAHAGEAVMGAIAGAMTFGMAGGLSLLLDVRQFTATNVIQGVVATALWTAMLAPLACRPLARLSHRFSGGDPAAGGSQAGSAARSW